MDTADPRHKPKIAIGFFGVTRSLKWTLPSIEQNIIAPARQLGEVRLFAHLYRQTHISNPRSGEDDALDPEEYRLLQCDEVTLEEPGVRLAAVGYERILAAGDTFEDGGISLANLINQLHSLQVLGRMISTWQPDRAILVRPDLYYHDNFKEILARQLSLEANAITIPNWQWYGGYNDRFAVCGAKACDSYTNRIDLIPDYLKKTGGPLPAERFLRFCLNQADLSLEITGLRASRVRVNGYTLLEDFSCVSRSKIFRRKAEHWLNKYAKRLGL